MKVALAIGAVVVTGAAIGLALERTGLYSPIGEPADVQAVYTAPYYACPGEEPLGDFHGRDRVFVTGRSADGAQLQVRAPYDPQSRVWVEARYLVADSSLEGIPEVDCAPEVAAASTTTTTSTSTTIAEPTTSSSSSSSSTSSSTTAGATTTPTTEAPITTGTTGPPPPPSDDQGPVIESFTVLFHAGQLVIWEDAAYGNCSASQVHTATIAAQVSDSSGVTFVWVDWSVGGSSGAVAASEIGESVYAATIGPFPDDTVGSDAPVFLQMTAYDGFANSTTVSSSDLVLLKNCFIG